jgi:hypothetical protein
MTLRQLCGTGSESVAQPERRVDVTCWKIVQLRGTHPQGFSKSRGGMIYTSFIRLCLGQISCHLVVTRTNMERGELLFAGVFGGAFPALWVAPSSHSLSCCQFLLDLVVGTLFLSFSTQSATVVYSSTATEAVAGRAKRSTPGPWRQEQLVESVDPLCRWMEWDASRVVHHHGRQR